MPLVIKLPCLVGIVKEGAVFGVPDSLADGFKISVKEYYRSAAFKRVDISLKGERAAAR